MCDLCHVRTKVFLHNSLSLYAGFLCCGICATAWYKSTLQACSKRETWLMAPCPLLFVSNLLTPPPQMLIEITEASSVITWDFDVCKGDVIFHIYHSKRAPQPQKKDSLGAHGIASPRGRQCPADRQELGAGPGLQPGGESAHLQGGRERPGAREDGGLEVVKPLSFQINPAASLCSNRAPTWRAGRVSTSSSGVSTARRRALPPACPVWTTSWPPCRSPPTSVRLCSTPRCWRPTTSGQCH